MPLGRGWRVALTLVVSMLQLQTLHGQRITGPMPIAAMAAPQSFWVKRTAASVPVTHGGKVRAGAGSAKKNADVYAADAAATKAVSTGKSESIADELEKGEKYAVVDCGGTNAVDAVARVTAFDDSTGAFAGGVSLSAAGTGNADGSVESGVDGAGVDDDVVPDAAGSAGC